MVWYQLSSAVTSGAVHCICIWLVCGGCVEAVHVSSCTQGWCSLSYGDMGDVFTFVSVSYSMPVK